MRSQLFRLAGLVFQNPFATQENLPRLMPEILIQVAFELCCLIDIVFQDDGSLPNSKPAKKLTGRPEHSEALSMCWSDAPKNETIRPSRRLGPSASRESEDPLPPSPV